MDGDGGGGSDSDSDEDSVPSYAPTTTNNNNNNNNNTDNINTNNNNNTNNRERGERGKEEEKQGNHKIVQFTNSHLDTINNSNTLNTNSQDESDGNIDFENSLSTTDQDISINEREGGRGRERGVVIGGERRVLKRERVSLYKAVMFEVDYLVEEGVVLFAKRRLVRFAHTHTHVYTCTHAATYVLCKNTLNP